MNTRVPLNVSRRELLKLAVMAGSATLIGSRGLHPTRARASVPDTGCGLGSEEHPTSPLIVDPFKDPLPIPRALAPVSYQDVAKWSSIPGPSNQSSAGGYHQLWPTQLGLPDPLYYLIKLQVSTHKFTTSKVKPLDANGSFVGLPPGAPGALDGNGERSLPLSTIYGFNGTFPGPMINAEYGRPVCVRFVNELQHANGLDRQDFGSPDWGFLTHLHNGHTACESDGNPFDRPEGGWLPGQWCDNLYLNWCPDGDAREAQSFLWFHDHFMHHTGANVYKGMVGLFPIYDPLLDPGDERNRKGLRLPGIRKNRSDGAFDVDYDIPLALYDCALDDGVTPHRDVHTGCSETHPEWWGKTFFRHYPNHGFVGDIFTVNGTAYPMLEVKRRKYRLRFLCASVTRIYELKLVRSTSGPKSAQFLGYTGKALQGQWRLTDPQQCMRFTQIAGDGGLLPVPIVRDYFELWPAKRREVIVDFSRYLDGTPTTKGDVIYLVNTMQMTGGRKPTEPFLEDLDGNILIDPATGQRIPNPEFDPNYCVPILKIVIGDSAPDASVVPKKLRARPPLPKNLKDLPQRTFSLQRTGTKGPENQWVINGEPFDPLANPVKPVHGSAEVWTIENQSGGWVHPLHIHEDEHIVVWRNGVRTPGAKKPSGRHADDIGKEDVIALDPGETVQIYRKFRTFKGKYVAHCHNLAHEDHSMMFGWEIV